MNSHLKPNTGQSRSNMNGFLICINKKIKNYIYYSFRRLKQRDKSGKHDHFDEGRVKEWESLKIRNGSLENELELLKSAHEKIKIQMEQILERKTASVTVFFSPDECLNKKRKVSTRIIGVQGTDWKYSPKKIIASPISNKTKSRVTEATLIPKFDLDNSSSSADFHGEKIPEQRTILDPTKLTHYKKKNLEGNGRPGR